MKQAYLDVARNFLVERPSAPTSTVTVQGSEFVDAPPYQSETQRDPVIPLAAYRQDGFVRRCTECAHVLSVAALRDVCGLCAARPALLPPVDESTCTAEAIQRGVTLVVLYRRHYPRLQLGDGRHVGPGLEAWAAVLREMDVARLASLAALVERTKRPIEPEPEL